MKAETLIFIISTVLGSNVVVVWLTSYLNRKRQQVEVGNLATEVFEKVIARQKQEMVDAENEIKALMEKDKIRERQHTECEQRGIAQGIELKILRQYIVDKNIEVQRFKILVLDDEDYVRVAFKKKFELTSITNVLLQSEIEPAWEVIKSERPDILVLDYRIHGMNIDKLITNIISMEQYDPKMILISGMDVEQYNKLPYKGFIWHFFSKRDDYINKTVNVTMEYIEQTIT